MQTNKKHSGYLPQNGGMIQEEISWPDKFSLVVKEAVKDLSGPMYSGAMKVFKFLATNNQPGNHAIFAMHALPFNESVKLLEGKGFNHMREVMKPYIQKVVRLCIEETGCKEWLDMQYRTTTSSFFVPLVLTNDECLNSSLQPFPFDSPKPLWEYNKKYAINILQVILAIPELREDAWSFTTRSELLSNDTLQDVIKNLNNNFASPSKNDISFIHSISKNKYFVDHEISVFIEALESIIDITNKVHINCVANNFGKFVDLLFPQVKPAPWDDAQAISEENKQTSQKKQDVILDCSKLAKAQWDHISRIPTEKREQFLTQNELFINDTREAFVTGNIQLEPAGQTQIVMEAENEYYIDTCC